MSAGTVKTAPKSASELTRTALVRSMVRKLRGFNPDSDEDTVLGTVLNEQDGGGKFIASAEMWKGLLLKAVWKRDKVTGQDYTDQLHKRWPSDWLAMTPQELAEKLLP